MQFTDFAKGTEKCEAFTDIVLKRPAKIFYSGRIYSTIYNAYYRMIVKCLMTTNNVRCTESAN